VRFDTVVFADRASIAALSCFSRLKSERDAGRKALLISLVDSTGAEAIAERGLATARRFEDVEDDNDGPGPSKPWRERISVAVRRLGPKHVMAPLGLLGAPQMIDYFSTLRAALSVDPGRDLLFFEERPQCLVPESVLLRLAAMGVRLPPLSQLRAPRRYAPFVVRLVTGLGLPPVFGGLGERSRMSRSVRKAFKEAADWDPYRSLGPKLQPVAEPWSEEESDDLFALAAELGQETGLGSRKAFKRRMARHAASAGSRTPIERYWLSLPGGAEADPSGDSD
jgi:hypothetical protein